tara:strand:- start:101 stop:589 length:489 start_codon:yes stop_codon:yes gene_type:complete
MKIIDNYLDENSFKLISETMSSDMFPWFFNDYKINPDWNDDSVFNYQFTHRFYDDARITSKYFDSLLNPILKKINAKALIRIKANLNPVSHELIKYNKHVDQDYSCKAAIYYVNSNNGYTMFDSQKVESKENRIVFFDAASFHSGTNSTDCKNRMVINFNYF